MLVALLKRLNEQTFLQSIEYARGNLFTAGSFGVFLFPVYWIVWKYIFPQPYENLTLRLIAAVICVPLLLESRLKGRWQKALPYYWFFTLTFCLPFFFFYMFLMNNNTIWIMSVLGAAVLLVQLVNWINFFLIFTSGLFVAVLYYNWLGFDPDLGRFSVYLPVIIFVALATNILNFNRTVVDRSRGEVMHRWATTMVHEMQTPFATIKLAARSIRRPILNGLKEQATREGFSFFIDETIRLCENALATARMIQVNTGTQLIEQGKYSLHSASDCVQRAIDYFPYDDESDRDMIQFEKREDFIFFGSDVLLIHVFYNLISNALKAIKRANKGAISISIREGPKQNELIFRDTGTGIPRRNLGRIFDRFFTTSSGFEGTGNGLYFCRLALKSFGGKIDCESKEGEYTIFRVRLPAQKDDF